MFLLGLAGSDSAFDPLVLLLIALLVEAALGEMRWLFRVVPHPVRVIGGAIGFLDRKLNREHRPAVDRAIRGAVLVLVVVVVTGAVGWGVAWLTVNHDFGWIVELFLVVALLAQRGLYESVHAVAKALQETGLEAGREAVSHIVGRDPARLDEHGVARAAIESCAENFSDAVVAPVFWYVLFGFPGLLVYKAVNTMDSMIGHTSARYRAFGMTAARLDDVLNLFPARIAGLYLTVASVFAPTASPAKAVRTMLRDAHKHRSPNAGWPEAATAGALDIALSGPRQYHGRVTQEPWVGRGRARLGPADIRRALRLYVRACLALAMLVAAVLAVKLLLAGPG